MSETSYRMAPPGFTDEQWQTFETEGFIVVEDALTEALVDAYAAAVDRAAAAKPDYREGDYCGRENIVELDPLFAGLIDNESMWVSPTTCSASCSNCT